MIKFALRRNLIYPLQLLIYAIIRDIEIYLIKEFLNFQNSSIFTLLMFFGEFLGGLIFHLLQRRFLSKNKKENELEFLNIRFFRKEINFTFDDKAKIFVLIIFLSSFDFVQFLLSLEISKFQNLSVSLKRRLEGSQTIYTALFFYFLLREPHFKHQIFSLKIITICLLFIIITEIIFQEINIFLSYGQFFLVIFIMLLLQLFHAYCI